MAEWLGLDASLGGSWSAEEPVLLSTDQINELLGPLRSIAGDAARLIFARELEHAIAEVLANPKRLARR